MVDTPRLLLPEISTAQSDKFDTHNATLQIIDILLQASVIDKDLTAPPGGESDGDMYIVGTGATGDWTGEDGNIAYYRSAAYVFYTAFEGLIAWIRDEDALYAYDGAAWVLAASGAFSALSDVNISSVAVGQMLRWNGTDWVNEDAPYDVGVSRVTGTPIASQAMVDVVLNRTVVFPSGLTGSVGKAGVAATAQTDFDIQKNLVSVGTMRFAASGTTATFIMATQTTFTAGDSLQVVAPGTPDATLADVAFTLKGKRT